MKKKALISIIIILMIFIIGVVSAILIKKNIKNNTENNIVEEDISLDELLENNYFKTYQLTGELGTVIKDNRSYANFSINVNPEEVYVDSIYGKYVNEYQDISEEDIQEAIQNTYKSITYNTNEQLAQISTMDNNKKQVIYEDNIENYDYENDLSAAIAYDIGKNNFNDKIDKFLGNIEITLNNRKLEEESVDAEKRSKAENHEDGYYMYDGQVHSTLITQEDYEYKNKTTLTTEDESIILSAEINQNMIFDLFPTITENLENNGLLYLSEVKNMQGGFKLSISFNKNDKKLSRITLTPTTEMQNSLRNIYNNKNLYVDEYELSTFYFNIYF